MTPALLFAPLAAGLAMLPLIPLMHGEDTLAPVGFDSQPYKDGDISSYAGGKEPWALMTRASMQLTEGDRKAIHAGGRFTAANRFGASAEWTGFERGALNSPEGADYVAGHFVANLSESEDQVLDYGIGIATLKERDRRWGGSLELGVESFPQRPLSVHGRYQLGVLTDRRAYHDLSLHVGLVWGKLGLGVGYRAFLNPLANSYGPDFELRAWF